MVLGQNIGTTVTANLAAIITNTTAKRAARAHLVFNVLGVVIALILFHPFLKIVDWISIKTGSYSPFPVEGQTIQQTSEAIPVALAVFHTIFNTMNTLLLVWFIPIIMKVVEWMVPQKEDDEEFRLKYISTGLMTTNELSILQAKKETLVYIERIEKMFQFARELIVSKTTKKD
ncbi:hypothetical protein ES705_46699 [subsurface metagenome]